MQQETEALGISDALSYSRVQHLTMMVIESLAKDSLFPLSYIPVRYIITALTFNTFLVLRSSLYTVVYNLYTFEFASYART